MKKGKTSTWNNRIIKKDGGFGIYEVHYTDGVPHSWTEKPVYGAHESVKELKYAHSLMKEAFSNPVLKVVKGKLVQMDKKI